MMKSVMLAAAALVATISFAAAAERPVILGYTEYAVEAETFEVGVGTEFAVGEKVTVAPLAIGFGPDEDFAFDRLEVRVTYDLNDNVDLYTELKTDEDLNYDETLVGVAFRF